MRRIVAASLIACVASMANAEAVLFDWFEYRGNDRVFDQPLPKGSYRNPILAGFYPDPSITRAGDRFYLVNSTFAYFPGIPVFESDDLVHWRQVGNAIERPSQLNFDGLGMSRGVFAPAIEYHDGTFYVINTSVDSGGNFFVTAKNPAGPWSDPRWLRFDGIDPSFFFDDNGKAYVVNNDIPEGRPKYDGHRAIWIQEFDVARSELTGPRKMIIDGGTDLAKKPVWIEGPHIYKRDGWYYLMCAEGGTSVDHSEVIFRSRSPWGPYEGYAGNPILTQRDLPSDRPDPIVNAGHADLVEAGDGSWWAVFLASRPYDRKNYNTGRQTFLLPMTWKEGWPVILEAGSAIPYVVQGPKFIAAGDQAPLSGNYTWRDEFDRATPDPAWIQVRVPKKQWFHLQKGALAIDPQPEALTTLGNPSFLARRQQHTTFDATTSLQLPREGVAAGLAAFQSEEYWYFLGARRAGGQIELFLEKCAAGKVTTIATSRIGSRRALQLRISGDGGRYDFSFDAGNGWHVLVENDDATILSTEVAGGFIGATVGPYARADAANK